MYRRYWWVLGMMLILTPLGLLAEGTAWGEWGREDLAAMLGFVPQGIEQGNAWWQAYIPNYGVKLLGEGSVAQSVGYVISAFFGSMLVYIATLCYTKLVTRNGTKQ
jgi:hypothetical protein